VAFQPRRLDIDTESLHNTGSIKQMQTLRKLHSIEWLTEFVLI